MGRAHQAIMKSLHAGILLFAFLYVPLAEATTEEEDSSRQDDLARKSNTNELSDIPMEEFLSNYTGLIESEQEVESKRFYDRFHRTRRCLVTVVTEIYGRYPCCAQDAFSVKKLLTNSPKEIHSKNYWLGPAWKHAEFILDLGCHKTVNMVELVNTHNGHARNAGTKEFMVFVSVNKGGPWTLVVHKELQDSRQQSDPLPVLSFSFSDRTARFVKFKLLSWYGVCGGLQYFAVKGVKCSGGWTKYGSSCYKLHPDKVSWAEARTFCLVQDNADLASIHSEGERAFAWALSGRNEDTWLGGQDLHTEGHWTWTDGTPWTWAHWARGEPNNYGGNQDCLTLWGRANGRFDDNSCTARLKFICKKAGTIV